MRSFFRWVHSLAYVVRGAHAMRCHDDEGVITHYSRAIEISPEDLDYYYARGHAYWHRRELGLAAADFSEAIDRHPGDLYAYLVRGAINRERGFMPQAIRDFNYVIAEGDAPVIAHYLRARCHADRKDFDLAQEDVNEVLKRDPRHLAARDLRLLCEEQLAEVAGGYGPAGNDYIHDNIEAPVYF